MAKKLLLSGLLSLGLSATAFASEQGLDLNKVNEVIEHITSTAIQGDDFYKLFEAKVDVSRTDLDMGKAAGSLEVVVGKTVWTGLPTSVGVAGGFVKSGEVIKQIPSQEEGGQPVAVTYFQTEVNAGATLKTETVPMVKYFWGLMGLCQGQEANAIEMGVYPYLEAKLCPIVSSGMESLTSIAEFVTLVENVYETTFSTISEYVSAKNDELSRVQNEDQKKLILSQIQEATSLEKDLKVVELTRTHDGLLVSVNFDPSESSLALEFNLTSSEASLTLNAIFDVTKENFEARVAQLKDLLFKIQTNEASVIQELTDSLKGYLDAVKDFTKGEE